MNFLPTSKTHHYTDIMFEHTCVGMAIFDAQDLRLLQANTLFLTLLDKSLDPCWRQGRVIGHTLTDWAKQMMLPDSVDIFREVIATGSAYQVSEYEVPTFTQGTSYWNWSLKPVCDQDGHVTHLVQTAYEITEQVLARQRAEQVQSALSQTHNAVEQERKRLEVIETVAHSVREFLDAEHIGNIAIDAITTHFNSHGACLHIADPAQQVLRLLCERVPPGSEEAFKAMQYIPYERLTMQPALRRHEPIVMEDMQAAAASGKIDKNHPLVLTGARGYICVYLWFGDHFEGTLSSTFKETIRSDGPEVRALVGSGTHLAAALAHARLHTTVERERTRLLSILDQLPEGILLAEISNGAISYANPAAAHILGIPLEELISVPLHQHAWPQNYGGTPLLGGRQILPWNFAVIRALCGETIKSKETLVTKPCGTKIVTLTSSAPLYTEGGLMTGAMIVFQDVTVQKSLEQHKNDFLSIANHELRTPITIIQGFAEILQLKGAQDQHLDPLTQYALTSIAEQSQHLTHLIEEMLDISRIEQTQFMLKRASHNLLSILTRAVESQAITTRQHHLHFVLEGLQATDTLMAYVDEERMFQVINNLISNAIKYSPAGGDIEVGLRHLPERPNEVTIWVKDHGIGIATHELQNIFKRFHRASNIDRSLSGFGIGLYLVKEVVARHEGRVWVESTEGIGSTFYVVLPLNRLATA